jgi:large subunit ribosomal protein L22
MEVKASAKYLKISPKKAREFVGTLSGMRAVEAMSRLKFHPAKTARLMAKLIKSAADSGANNYNLKQDNLRIKALGVDEGPRSKRLWYRSHGSADRLLKRTSHFWVVLDEIKPSLIKKTVVTPAATETAPKEKSETVALASAPIINRPPKTERVRTTKVAKQMFKRNTTNK